MTVSLALYNKNKRDSSLSPLTTKCVPNVVNVINTIPMTLQQQQRQPLVAKDESAALHDIDRREPLPSENDDDDDDCCSVNSDVSSLPSFGSIRPDPNYDFACDPMNPINIQKNEPFIPPKEITIKIIRGRRRKIMGPSGGVRSEQNQRQEQQPQNMQTPLHTTSLHNKQQSSPQNPRHRFSTTTLRRPLSTIISPPSSLMIPALKHSFTSKSTVTTHHELSSEMFVSDDVFYNDHMTTAADNSIIVDDDDDEDNEFAEQQQQQLQQQQLPNQRRGMVRRELGRRMFEWKKKKTNSNNTGNVFSEPPVMGMKPDRVAIIDGNDIDRVFGAAAVSNRNKDNSEKENIAANSNTNSNNKETTKKSKWHTSMFATPNIFVKQGQEKNFESSFVV